MSDTMYKICTILYNYYIITGTTITLYKTAKAFGGLATPPLTFNGALVRKKLYFFSFLHTSANCSRFQSSPMGVPHMARRWSWSPSLRELERQRKRVEAILEL